MTSEASVLPAPGAASKPPPAAFDALAADYDASFTRSGIGRRMREAVWRHLDTRFSPGDRVLEIGCGTGEDAIHLARRGVEVLATDASEGMVATAGRKIGAAGLEELVEVRQMAIEALDRISPLPGEGPGVRVSGGLAGSPGSGLETLCALAGWISPRSGGSREVGDRPFSPPREKEAKDTEESSGQPGPGSGVSSTGSGTILSQSGQSAEIRHHDPSPSGQEDQAIRPRVPFPGDARPSPPGREALRAAPGEGTRGLQQPPGTFDGALSNFGALNCVENLDAVAHGLAAVLRPGASAFLCIMGPRVPWEWAWFLGHGQPAKAFRRLEKGGTPWRGLTVRYPSVGRARRTFAPWFRCRRAVAVGALLPPSYAEGWAERHPRLLAWLDRFERRLEGWFPLPQLADHYLLELVRR